MTNLSVGWSANIYKRLVSMLVLLSTVFTISEDPVDQPYSAQQRNHALSNIMTAVVSATAELN
jgi:hypothetical protein